MGFSLFRKKIPSEEESTYDYEYKRERLRRIPEVARARARADTKTFRQPIGSRFKQTISTVGAGLEKAAAQRGDYVRSGFFPSRAMAPRYKTVKVPIKKKATQKFTYKKVRIKQKSSPRQLFSYRL